MSRTHDIADLCDLIRALLSIWSPSPGMRPRNRDALITAILLQLPFDRCRLESLLMLYGADLLVVFRAARDAVRVAEALEASS